MMLLIYVVCLLMMTSVESNPPKYCGCFNGTAVIMLLIQILLTLSLQIFIISLIVLRLVPIQMLLLVAITVALCHQIKNSTL